MTVRVRFAPSPTGHLHVGGARTALFNWLFARQKAGVFLLRIEDTDEKRSREELVEGILAGLRWLGLDWDEGPYFQSDRLPLYRKRAEKLLDEGAAYRDFTSPGAAPALIEEIRRLPPEVSGARAARGEPYAVRFKVPRNRRVSFTDLVFGRIEVDAENLEDFVILRSDGKPTYHLSAVVDDLDMRITHVIRGADHLPNTSKQVLLYQALAAPLPLFVHLPLIMGPDKSRLSKRHGATSLSEYRLKGLLPAAVRNYLALLGWSPGDDSELLDGEPLILRFDLSRINRTNAVFDFAKLEWMNKQYLSSLPAGQLAPLVREQLVAAGIWDDRWSAEGHERFLMVVDLIKSRVESLLDFSDYGRPYFSDDFEYSDEAQTRYLSPGDPVARQKLALALQELRNAFASLEPFDLLRTEESLRGIAASRDLKAGLLIGAVRLALTGRLQAPGIFDVVVALGRRTTLERLDRLIRFLSDV